MTKTQGGDSDSQPDPGFPDGCFAYQLSYMISSTCQNCFVRSWRRTEPEATRLHVIMTATPDIREIQE